MEKQPDAEQRTQSGRSSHTQHRYSRLDQNPTVPKNGQDSGLMTMAHESKRLISKIVPDLCAWLVSLEDEESAS
jgi:hypothetical protein